MLYQALKWHAGILLKDMRQAALSAAWWKSKRKIRVYANGWYQGPREPQAFAEKAAQMVEAGYTALKFDPLWQSL